MTVPFCSCLPITSLLPSHLPHKTMSCPSRITVPAMIGVFLLTCTQPHPNPRPGLFPEPPDPCCLWRWSCCQEGEQVTGLSVSGYGLRLGECRIGLAKRAVLQTLRTAAHSSMQAQRWFFEGIAPRYSLEYGPLELLCRNSPLLGPLD